MAAGSQRHVPQSADIDIDIADIEIRSQLGCCVNRFSDNYLWTLCDVGFVPEQCESTINSSQTQRDPTALTKALIGRYSAMFFAGAGISNQL